ncbi:MAG: hypothetical protein RSB16_03165 [Raoultibacter sp.]
MVALALVKLPLFRLSRTENGMVSLESAFVYPVFFLLIFVLAQFSWIGFQAACLDHGLYAMGWTLDSSRVETAPDLNALVASTIQADWMPLDEQCLVVKNARVDLSSRKVTSPTRNEIDHETFFIERTCAQRHFMHLVADLEYRIDPLVNLPGFGSITLVRHLDKTQLIDARFEVS